MTTNILIIVSFIILLLSFFIPETIMGNIAGIATACYFAIMARISQAGDLAEKK